MNTSQGFEEGYEGYDIAAIRQSSDSDSTGVGENAYKAKCDLGACSPRPLVLEDRQEENDLHALCEGINIDIPTMHYYVDVQNDEEIDYDLSDQHIRIEPTFCAHIHEGLSKT